jgi:hypothetical protein
MIKTLLLICYPIPTWDRIVSAQRKWGRILALHLVPLLIITSALEGYGLVHWGKPRGRAAHLNRFSVPETVVFETGQFLLSLAIVFFAARTIKSLGETFHGRHSFTQTFTVAAYGLSPLFLFRALDAFPFVSPWLTWALGMFFSASLLYHGLPRVMRPDPPHALGLYLMSVLLLVILTGLTAFLTAWFLQGKFTKLDTLIGRFTGQ